MKIIREKQEVKAYKAKKPKIDTRNANWSDTEVEINGELHGVWWECMRGANYYFVLDGQWYRVPFVIGSGFAAVDNLNDNLSYGEKWTIKSK